MSNSLVNDDALVNIREGVVVVQNQFILTSAGVLIDADPEGAKNVKFSGNLLYQYRPKWYDVVGWYKLIKLIYKYVPEKS